MKYTYILIILSLLLFSLKQCDKTQQAQDEINRIKNNNIALKDTIRYHTDKNGYLIGEIRGLELKLEELDKEFSKEPVTIIEYITEVHDSIIFKPVIDTVIILKDSSYIYNFNYTDKLFYDKSSSFMSFNMPISVKDNILNTGDVTFGLSQNIWIEASILQENKEVFVNLKTDYPGITFNNTRGILIKKDEGFLQFTRNQRKQFGLGLQIGLGYTDRITPYVGIGVSYTPRWLQW